MVVSAAKKVDRRGSILDAAVSCFARYGYRRTTMDEVAREAGISRAALYLYFENKESLFRAISASIDEKLLASAEAAATRPGSLEQRLTGVFDAKISEVFELLADTEHGAELLDENNRICGDISTDCKERFQAILVKVLLDAEQADEIVLDKRGLSAENAADLIHSAVAGVESFMGPDLTPDRFRQELAQMLKILVAGIIRR
jgi:AcrR family transcriptional regulator